MVPSWSTKTHGWRPWRETDIKRSQRGWFGRNLSWFWITMWKGVICQTHSLKHWICTDNMNIFINANNPYEFKTLTQWKGKSGELFYAGSPLMHTGGDLHHRHWDILGEESAANIQSLWWQQLWKWLKERKCVTGTKGSDWYFNRLVSLLHSFACFP